MLTLQTRSNAKKYTGKYTWAAISKLMQKLTGQTFDYDMFQQKYDSSPLLQHIVSDFNDQGLTLNVKAKKKDHSSMNVQHHDVGVNSSAKKAAAHTLKRNKG